MRRPTVTTFPDGRRCYTDIVFRECEGYEASLPDLLARIHSLLPTEADRASAKITVTDAGFIVTRTRVESDAEHSARTQAERAQPPPAGISTFLGLPRFAAPV